MHRLLNYHPHPALPLEGEGWGGGEKKEIPKQLNYLGWRLIVPVLAWGILLVFFAPAWSESYGTVAKFQARGYRPEYLTRGWKAFEDQDQQILMARKRRKEPTPQTEESRGKYWRNNESLSPEEKARREKRYQEWKRFPAEKKRLFRRKMEKWRELSPEERSLYRRRFHQWQELSPEERERIRKNLQQWNGLPTEEKEQIRRRFRKR